jgi:hypothetical protein
MFNVVNGGGDVPLKLHDDAVTELLWRKASVVPDDRDNWNINVGENVDRSAQYHHWPEEQQEQ